MIQTFIKDLWHRTQNIKKSNSRVTAAFSDKKGLSIDTITKSIRMKTILGGVSFYLQKGESIGILGPNGAGKTTCFSIVIGLTRPDSGHIFLDGQDITLLPMFQRAKLGISYLPQETSVFRGMTVEQNILAAIEIAIRDPDERSEKLDSLLDEFSLSHLRHSSALSLSGGERRRVEIARSLALSPQFILLDEPLAGIDPIVVGEIRELIIRLKNKGIGVLITDHNVRETLSVVDRAYILAEGCILAEGKPSDIVQNPDVRRVYLGENFSL